MVYSFLSHFPSLSFSFSLSIYLSESIHIYLYIYSKMHFSLEFTMLISLTSYLCFYIANSLPIRTVYFRIHLRAKISALYCQIKNIILDTHTYTHIHIYIYIYIYIYTFSISIYIHLCVCVFVCMYSRVDVCVSGSTSLPIPT